MCVCVSIARACTQCGCERKDGEAIGSIDACRMPYVLSLSSTRTVLGTARAKRVQNHLLQKQHLSKPPCAVIEVNAHLTLCCSSKASRGVSFSQLSKLAIF